MDLLCLPPTSECKLQAEVEPAACSPAHWVLGRVLRGAMACSRFCPVCPLPTFSFVSERLFRRAREQSRTLVLRTHRNLVACWIPPASLIENVECPLDKESRSVPETSQGSCNADGLSEVFAGKGAGAVAASSLPNYTVMTCHFPSLFFFL